MNQHKPKCPHCGKRVACEEAVEDGTRCPHCHGPICWTVPFGSMSFGGSFTEARDKTPKWNVREDYCSYCRGTFPYGTLVHDFCKECREGRGRRCYERHLAWEAK